MTHAEDQLPSEEIVRALIAERRRTEERLRLLAEEGLRAHALAYVVVNAILIGAWAATDRGYFWPRWPLLGWGVGLASHAWIVHEVDAKRRILDAAAGLHASGQAGCGDGRT